MPKPYMLLAIAVMSVGLALVAMPMGGSFWFGPAIAAVVFASFEAAYRIWRFQSRRRGPAA
jgi:hypothetical protein